MSRMSEWIWLIPSDYIEWRGERVNFEDNPSSRSISQDHQFFKSELFTRL